MPVELCSRCCHIGLFWPRSVCAEWGQLFPSYSLPLTRASPMVWEVQASNVYQIPSHRQEPLIRLVPRSDQGVCFPVYFVESAALLKAASPPASPQTAAAMSPVRLGLSKLAPHPASPQPSKDRSWL